jgi:hypothetical protein
VPQSGQQPAFHHLDPNFDFGFIPWLGGTRRDHGKAIVAGQISRGAIELGFIAVGMGHGRFEVIGDNDVGDPAEGRKGPHMRADPVGQTLGPGRLSVGIVGRAQDRNENGRFMHLTAVAVDHRDTLAGVIL